MADLELVHVLHVDDDAMVLEYVEEFVRSVEPRIVFTNTDSPVKAIDLLAGGGFDCVVTDYMMPGMNGIELATKIRRVHGMPIILYTGQGSEEVAERAYAEGISDYIRKEIHPAHYQVLARRILNAVDKRRADERAELYRRRLEALHVHVVNLEQAASYDQVYQATLDAVESVLGFHLMTWLQVEGDNLVVKANRGFDVLNLTIPLSGRGITVKASRTKTSILVEDVRADPGFLKGKMDTLSELAVPVVVDGETTNVINLESLDLNAFTEEDRRLLEVFSNHVGLALKRLRMLESERRTRLRLEMLQTNAIKLSNSTMLGEILDATVEILCDQFRYPRAAIWRVDEKELVCLKVIGAAIGVGTTIPLNRRSISLRAIETRESQLIPDTSLDEDYLVIDGKDSRAKSELAVPISIDGQVEFLINLESEELNAFSDEDKRLMELLSLHFGSAVSLNRRREKLASLHLHASKMTLATSIEDIVDITLTTLREVLEFNICSFHVLDGERIEILGSVGFTKPDDFHQTLNGPGLIPYAMRVCRPVNAPDVSKEENYLSVPDAGIAISSELVIPITVDGVAAAAINLEDVHHDAFTAEDVEHVELLANHVAQSMARIRLQEANGQYALDLEALHKFSRNLATLTTVEDVTRYSFDIIDRMLGLTEGAFGVVEDGHIRFIYATTATADPLPPMPLNGRGIAVRAVRTGETQLVHDTSKDPDFAMDGEPSSLCSELDIPIKIDGKVVALINLETPRLNAYSEQDRRVVEILSEHVASVLYRIREESRLRGMEEERERGLADGAAEAVDMARRDLSMPLQTIQNASYLIRRRLVGAEEGANKIDNAVDLCVSTLDGLRMITNPQLLRRQPHDLNHLLRRSLTDSGISGKVKVKFMNATPVMAYVDGTKLGSVITNLLRKASESMPKGGDLSVDIGVNGDAATISITDTGSYHTRDSAPGESTPSRIAILDETSLEFILCRRIVEAHGGEIHLHKREKSSDLTIKLPTGEGVPQKIRRYVNTSL